MYIELKIAIEIAFEECTYIAYNSRNGHDELPFEIIVSMLY